MKKLLGAITLIIFSLSITGCIRTVPESIEVLMKAEKEAAKGRYEKAIKRLEEYQKAHPDMPQHEYIWYKETLARYYEEIGEIRAAISILDELLKEQPYQEYEELCFRLARLYLEEGDKQKAEAMFEKAKELANINLELKIGRQYEKVKELDKAEGIYTRVSHKFPYCYLAYIYLGNVSRKMGKLNQAISNYKKGLELNPTDIEACKWLGVLYAINGQKDEAEALFKKIAKIWHWEGAIRLAKAVIAFLNSDAYTIGFLQDEKTLKYLRQGDINVAIEAFKEEIIQQPQSLKWHFYLAVLYFIKEENNQAKQAFKKVISIAPQSNEAKLSKVIMQTLLF